MLQTLITTFLIAITPIGELRAAIPFAIYQGLHPLAAYGVAVIGNMIPIMPLLWFLPWFERIAERKMFEADNAPNKSFTYNLHRAYRWLKKRTERKHSARFKKLGAIALVAFVAIPLPLTGAWSRALASYSFNIPKRIAFFLIFLGVLIAGAIMLFTSVSIL